MEFAFLLLGLLPLAFLSEPDMADDAEESDNTSGAGSTAPLPAIELTQPVTDQGAGELAPPDDLLLDPEDAPPDEVPPDPDDVLAPVIEDDEPGATVPDPGTILTPVDDIDTPSGEVPPDPEDVLLPIDEIDTAGGDTWLNLAEDTGLGYTEISGFEPGQDVLQISVPEASADSANDVRIELAENDEDSLIFLDDELVAVLVDARQVTAADIIITLGPT